jgi:hypothetical protein
MSYQSDLSFDASLTIPLLRVDGVQNFADITSPEGKITGMRSKRQVTRDRISDGIPKWTEFLSNAQRDRIKVQRHFGMSWWPVGGERKVGGLDTRVKIKGEKSGQVERSRHEIALA